MSERKGGKEGGTLSKVFSRRMGYLTSNMTPKTKSEGINVHGSKKRKPEETMIDAVSSQTRRRGNWDAVFQFQQTLKHYEMGEP